MAVRVATAGRAGLGDDQGTHQVRALSGQQQRRQRAKRLTDDHHPAQPQPLHGEGGIDDMRGT